MSYTPSYKAGDWKAICQRCGSIFKGSELRRTWDGLYVCKDDWEPKHPQLYVTGVRDDQRPPFVLPDTTDVPAEFEVSPIIATVGKYTTDLLVGSLSERPDITSIDSGTRFFDTTLGVIIFAGEDTWYYRDGTPVSGEDYPDPKGIGYWAIETTFSVG